MPHSRTPDIRPGRDTDGPALIALIWACWSAYPGVLMDVDAEMPELHALATYYADQGGALWVAETGGAPIGMIATRPLQDHAWEICRVYVDPGQHGSGLGHRLLNHAERYAIAAGACRLVLYSDTRFNRAHGFYEKHAYIRRGPIRVLNDISSSLEYGYSKPVDGIEQLDIAAAESAAPRLAALLVASVDSGARVGFLKPVAHDKALGFWRRAATDVGAGRRLILAAWRGGDLVGAAILDLATPEDEAHRAAIHTILVDPAVRRTGLGRQLLQRLEEIAAAGGRSVLTLQAPDEAAEALARAQGWHLAGRVPGFTRDVDGTAQATAFFWKHTAGDYRGAPRPGPLIPGPPIPGPPIPG